MHCSLLRFKEFQGNYNFFHSSLTIFSVYVRYRLLLTELLKETKQDDPDYENINSGLKFIFGSRKLFFLYHFILEAVVEMTKVADHINNHIKQQDNAQRMIAIQKSLCGTSVPQLVQPGRVFLKEGNINKVSRKGGKVHDRKLILFSDILIYCKPSFSSHKPYR